MDGRQWLDSYQHELQELRSRAQRAQTALAGVAATTASPDGSVTVTVAPGGALQRVVFSEQSAGLSRTQLGALVVETVARAHAEAASLATAALAPLIGERSEAMRILRTHLQAAT